LTPLKWYALLAFPNRSAVNVALLKTGLLLLPLASLAFPLKG
jgi:hypothetical protein